MLNTVTFLERILTFLYAVHTSVPRIERCHRSFLVETNKYQLSQMDPRDAPPAVVLCLHRKAEKGIDFLLCASFVVKGKGSPYSITERRVPELIPVLGSQPAGDVSHRPGSRLPLLSARPAVTPATLKRAATNFAAW